MKPTDLRIGNNIHNGVVISLDQTYATLAGHYNISGMASIEFRELIPTHITKEWLNKFGFFDNDTIGVFVNGRYDLERLTLDSDEWGFCINEEQTGTKIKYVHELQNLYFALTGKELNT